MARTQNPLAVVLSRLGEVSGGRYSLADQPNPGIPHVVWRYKKADPIIEAKIAHVVETFRGQVPWVFRRGTKNMVIEPADPPVEPPVGSPSWSAFQEFVRIANQDLLALAAQMETLAGPKTAL